MERGCLHRLLSRVNGLATISTSSPKSAIDLNALKIAAMERKWELTALREELKRLEECGKGVQQDVFPLSCRCHFFDRCGSLNSGSQNSRITLAIADSLGSSPIQIASEAADLDSAKIAASMSTSTILHFAWRQQMEMVQVSRLRFVTAKMLPPPPPI
ncbi:hypothetical protein Taro_015424 [Colocasia esculenta]|uniref:Uncharacterized protein n=1 Tax=Colocasia esculenta TaxID=4460 RepID=A0A843UMA2_COLES|nr:hypothetical protein [Colocasia esculenta]